MGTKAVIALQEQFSEPETAARLHLEAEVHRLRHALRTYGTHRDECKGKPCTCGLEMAQMEMPIPSVPDIQAILAQVFQGRFKYVAALLWAGLLKYQPRVTLDQVYDLMDETPQSELKPLLAALGLTMVPDATDVKELAEGSKKRNPRKARAGTGAKSRSKRVSLV
jgi:aryl-alcohol dehydrogenase-like predicted oxidoreductase